MLIDKRAQFLQVGVRFRQVLTVGTFALKKIGDCVGAETVYAQLKPEPRDVEHFLLYSGIIVVQIWLTGVETMPEILTCLLIPCPIRGFCIEKDNTRVLVFLIGVAPDVVISKGGITICARGLKPGMLIGCVIQHQVHNDAEILMM